MTKLCTLVPRTKDNLAGQIRADNYYQFLCPCLAKSMHALLHLTCSSPQQMHTKEH